MRQFFVRFRIPIIVIVVAVGVLAFLAFRPDKLFIDDVVDEDLADAFTTTTAAATTTTTSEPPATTTTEAAGATTTVPETTTTTTTEPPPAEPVAVTAGSFYGIDHGATGTATVYEFEGSHVLRFEDDTDIQNGPDLYVWVLPDEDYGGGTPQEYIDLGKIKGNVGGQNYELPDGFDPTVHRSVLIWCLRFDVPFAAAPLA